MDDGDQPVCVCVCVILWCRCEKVESVIQFKF